MNRFLLSLLYLLIVSHSFGNEIESHVITTERKLIVKNNHDICITEKSRILINRKADVPLGFSHLRETDFIELSKIDAAIYDITGNQLKKLSKNDIEENTVSYNSIYNEHRSIAHHLSYPVLPYIIENELEYKIKSTFFLPAWDPQNDINVDHARLEIELRNPIDFRYRNIGSMPEPVISIDDKGYKHYIWQADSIPKFEDEYKSAPEAHFQIGVKLEPAQFELDGHEGSCQSWQDFGTWCNRLFKDRMTFSPENKIGYQFIPIVDKKERVREIYHYLQKNTRYAQIYLGIDGWQPHPVDDIHRFKYGDCKDLSVYMIALLNQANIDAYPGLVLTRKDGLVNPDYPSNQFNHCIAVVPMPDDTLYLECTSDFTSISNFPSNIEGTHILLIKPNNSQLITAPSSRPQENSSVFNANAIIQSDRSLDLSGTLTTHGNIAIELRNLLCSMTDKDRKEWIARKISKKSGDVIITTMGIDSLLNPEFPLIIHFEASLNYFASKAGNRYIFNPTIFHQILFDGEKPDERKMPLLNSTVYTAIDQIHFSFPSGYHLKNSIEPDSVQSPYGMYSKLSEYNGDDFIWTSKFILNKRFISLDEYPGYYDFMEDCKKRSKNQLVLINN